MRVQISRFPPHQNGKVFAVLFALSTLVFVIPFMVIAWIAAPQDQSPPLLLIVLLPVFYLVIGYVMVAASCWVYNVMFKHIGGVEFEQQSADA